MFMLGVIPKGIYGIIRGSIFLFLHYRHPKYYWAIDGLLGGGIKCSDPLRKYLRQQKPTRRCGALIIPCN